MLREDLTSLYIYILRHLPGWILVDSLGPGQVVKLLTIEWSKDLGSSENSLVKHRLL